MKSSTAATNNRNTLAKEGIRPSNAPTILGSTHGRAASTSYRVTAAHQKAPTQRKVSSSSSTSRRDSAVVDFGQSSRQFLPRSGWISLGEVCRTCCASLLRCLNVTFALLCAALVPLFFALLHCAAAFALLLCCSCATFVVLLLRCFCAAFALLLRCVRALSRYFCIAYALFLRRFSRCFCNAFALLLRCFCVCTGFALLFALLSR
jgi:hypothetical protein